MPGLGEHMPGGGGARFGGAGIDDPRQISDRQLQEQLSRLANSNPYPRDDPMVILTLSGVTLGITLTIVVSKNRRRISRYLAGRGQLLSGFGTPAPAGTSLVAATAAGASSSSLFGRTSVGETATGGAQDNAGGTGAAAGGGPAGGLSTPFSLSSHQKRAVAAALRDAMVAADVSKLESAVQAAESAALEPALLSRAKQLLGQRRKKEKEKERAVQAAAKAKAKDAAKRGGRGASRGGAESHTSRGSSRGPTTAESVQGSDDGRWENDTNGGSARRGQGWLSMFFCSFRTSFGRSQGAGTDGPADTAAARDDHTEPFNTQSAHDPSSSVQCALVKSSPSTDMAPDQGIPHSKAHSQARAPAHGHASSQPPPSSTSPPGLQSSDYSDSVSSYNGSGWPAAGPNQVPAQQAAAPARKGSGGSASAASGMGRGGSSRDEPGSGGGAAEHMAAPAGASMSDDDEGWVQQTSKPRRKATPAAQVPLTSAYVSASPYTQRSASSRDINTFSAPAASAATRVASAGTSALTSTLGSLSGTARQLKSLSVSSVPSLAGSTSSSHITPLTATRVSAAEFTSLMGGALHGVSNEATGNSFAAAGRTASDVSRTSSGQLGANAVAGSSKNGATAAQPGGWLGWIGIAGSSSTTAVSPTAAQAKGASGGSSVAAPTTASAASTTTMPSAASPVAHGKRGKGTAAAKAATGYAAATAATATPSKSASTHAADAAILTRASPVKTSKNAAAAASHKAASSPTHPSMKAGASPAAHASAAHTKQARQPVSSNPEPAAASPTASSLLGAISSFIGYGSSSSGPAAAAPVIEDSAQRAATYDPLDSLLPATLLDGPYHPSPSSRPLNPAAPSFHISGSASARRYTPAEGHGTAAGAAVSTSGATDQSQQRYAQPGTGLFSSASMPLSDGPFVQLPGPHMLPTAHTLPPSALSTTSHATSPTSPGSAYSNGGTGTAAGSLSGLSLGAAAGMLGNPFRATASLSSAPLTGLRASHLGAALASLAAPVMAAGNQAATAAGSNGSGSGTPLRNSLVAPLADVNPAAAGVHDMPNLAHRSLGSEGLSSMGGSHGSGTFFGAAGTSAAPSALGSFAMFAGSSVWSPSATNGDGGSDGWGTAAAAGGVGARGVAATWGGLSIPSVPTLSARHTTATFVPAEPRGSTGRASLGSPVLALGSGRATSTLCGLPAEDLDLSGPGSTDAELQANPWAQDIMRNVVD